MNYVQPKKKIIVKEILRERNFKFHQDIWLYREIAIRLIIDLL